MRNKFVLSALLLVVATGLTWAQFWKDYPASERRTLAESYWLAGAQYQAVGERDKGAEFQSLARIIDPSMDPSAITDTSLPSAAELLASGRAASIGAGASNVPAASLSSFFLRYVSALLAQDAVQVAPFLDGSVWMGKTSAEVKSADSAAAFSAYFSTSPLAGKKAADLYDLESMVITRATQPQQDAWGETYTLTVNARADLSGGLAFWEPKQQYFVHRTGTGWKIFAVGASAPPLSWKPAAAAAATVPAAPAAAADPSAAITGSFKDFMGALLSKKADESMAHFASSVRFLRLRQTVTSDELKTTMLGVFDKAQFASADPVDSLDLSSIFVQPADSPVDGVTGTVYVLNVKSTKDLSADIPFWGAYMQYYFIQEGDGWVIFAVM